MSDSTATPADSESSSAPPAEPEQRRHFDKPTYLPETGQIGWGTARYTMVRTLTEQGTYRSFFNLVTPEAEEVPRHYKVGFRRSGLRPGVQRDGLPRAPVR